MIRRLVALLLLAALVIAGLYVWKAGPHLPSLSSFAPGKIGAELSAVGHDIQNAKVKAAVKTALSLNRTLKPFSIDVDMKDANAVVLQGEVASEELKATAERVVAAVPDVERVENQLSVNPGLLPPAEGRTVGEVLDDRALELQVRLAFSLDRHLKGTKLDVHAYRRDVVLGGEVEREDQRPIAIDITRNVPGVGGVVDEIGLRGQAQQARAAASLGDRARAAEQALATNPHLADYGLHVKEQAAHLVLTGRVKTAVEKELAGYVAKDAAGSPVENALEVES